MGTVEWQLCSIDRGKMNTENGEPEKSLSDHERGQFSAPKAKHGSQRAHTGKVQTIQRNVRWSSNTFTI